jgi:hypothetical protein
MTEKSRVDRRCATMRGTVSENRSYPFNELAETLARDAEERYRSRGDDERGWEILPIGEGNTGIALFERRHPHALEPFPYEDLFSFVDQRGGQLVGHAEWPVSGEADMPQTLVVLLESASAEQVEADCAAVREFIARMTAAERTGAGSLS